MLHENKKYLNFDCDELGLIQKRYFGISLHKIKNNYFVRLANDLFSRNSKELKCSVFFL
jgi:hypothetical protein